MMNILVIDEDWPSICSGKGVRVLNIFSRLKKNCRLHFLYIGDNSPRDSFLPEEIFESINMIKTEKRCIFWGKVLNLILLKPGFYAKWRYRDFYEKVKKILEKIIMKKNIDILHIFGFFTAQYAMELKGVGRIWDICDSYYLNIKRRIKFENFLSRSKLMLYAKRLYNYEKEMIEKLDRTIFVSSVDASMHRNLKHKISIITNGVDGNYFQPQEITEEPFSLVFTGHMNFEPNARAMYYFIEEVYPIVKKSFPQVKLYIVGAKPPSELEKLNGKDGIIITGKVDDIREYVARSTVFIAPMVSGAGVKNKILQAMAMGKAIVSTRLGVEALDVTEKEILVADNSSEFAEKVMLLLRDAQLRKELGVNARRKVIDVYNWEKVKLKYENIYAQLCENLQ